MFSAGEFFGYNDSYGKEKVDAKKATEKIGKEAKLPDFNNNRHFYWRPVFSCLLVII